MARFIEINLLPEELRKRKKKPEFEFDFSEFPFRKIMVVIACLVFVVQMALFGVNYTLERKANGLGQACEALKTDEQTYRSLKKIEADLVVQAAAYRDLYESRILWAREMNALSDSMIEGVWLDRFTAQRKRRQPAQSQRRRLGAGGDELISLELIGYASSRKVEDTALVGNFIQTLKENKQFLDDFSDVRLVSMSRQKFLSNDVMQFKLDCEFK